MARPCRLLLAGLLVVAACGAAARAQAIPYANSQNGQAPASKPSATAPLERYELSPQQRAKAIAYSRAAYRVYFAGVALTLLIYFFFWRARFGVTLRSLARRASPRLLIQCLIATPLLLAAASLIEFPLDFYSGFIIEHRFGLSSESLAAWISDWGKGWAITAFVAMFAAWIFYAVVRRSPRRWWFYFWLAMLPAALFVIFSEPYVVEPMFYKFVPLERSQPALTVRIEEVLRHAGLSIPPSRIFEMNASAKTNAMDAYVSGFGPSKRVVVWDTTLAHLSPDEILLVVGHEVGHYVLHHVAKEFAWIELVTLGFFVLGFWWVRLLARQSRLATGLEGEGDVASLPLVLMVLTLLAFLASPAVNAISRHYEHQADQFALEVTYGVVPDPNAAEARALEVLGVQDLADPDPSPFIKFWLYSHPPLDERIRFAASYHPWAEGRPMELLPPQTQPH